MSATTRRRARQVYRVPVRGRVARPAGLDPVTELCRTADAVRAHLERVVLRQAGMTWTTYDVLLLVCARRVIEPPHIASLAGVARSTLTSVLAALTDQGLVLRELHEHDQRRVVVRPTAAGAVLADRMRRQIEARLAQMFTAAGMPRHDDFAAALAALASLANARDGVGVEAMR
ncbi:MarR family winged helix-turn-helix transcriptional regulator [Micromonospora sp. HUAS LYJ1]|uniref:MarR family winged helix-turn-helix transcriptional regulator n=1 Tax=Micromonospora sp. HUAS LYJ1 TaxID=3061626 RepID=UPI002672459B|nr:MarR family transcriptional regulator [Micromonospora sp. HUAS LYJ1]WKU03495.1 MarR family transcriptional regulator [Micromonospora sp. HUAS LYJ1]